MEQKIVGLIPARAGSKRVKSKNVRLLNGHPLIAYTISAAQKSRVFSSIIVSTDSDEIAEIARYYGATVPFMRPKEFAEDLSPDIDWIEYTLQRLRANEIEYECFSILRPTSPFRQAETIQRAWKKFSQGEGFDSLRAVELCKQHPYKMWVKEDEQIKPLFPGTHEGVSWHSRAYQSLPPVYVQNASLEIARTRIVLFNRTISGDIVMPFFTEGYEGFDINTKIDFIVAEMLVNNKMAVLPSVERSPYSG